MKSAGAARLPRTARVKPWRPVLTGQDAREALELARALGETLGSLTLPADAGVGHGAAGNALLFAQLDRAFPYQGFAERREREACRAVDALATTPLTPSLCAGFTGVAWAMSQLDPRASERIDFDDVDAAVSLAVRARRGGSWFDLIDGLAGIGMYSLSRLPAPRARAALERSIDELAARAQQTPAGLCWPSLPEHPAQPFARQCPDGFYDLGMAHGVAGVITFLAAARDRLESSAASELLDGALGWLGGVRNDPSVGSLYPDIVATRPGQLEPRPSRVAWCYGDLGIAWALWCAGRNSDEALSSTACAVARAAAARPFERTGVVDASLCHGASGIAHVLGRLASESGDPELLRAATSWCRRAMAMVGDARTLETFARDVDGRRELDTSLMTGAAGVALAVLAASSDLPPDWDGFLGLSTPDPSFRAEDDSRTMEGAEDGVLRQAR